MKKICLFFFLLTLPFLAACQGDYSLMYEDIDQISSIEIVDVSGVEIESLLLIDPSLYEEFLQGLSSLNFHNVFGEPPTPGGVCVKIVYTNNDYEVFNHYGSYKIHSAEQSVSHGWRVCDEEEFNDWIDVYYSGE